jgi:uncharacterized protein YpiB (UPF0302 family)
MVSSPSAFHDSAYLFMKKKYMLNSVAGATLRIMSENPIFVKVHFEEGYEVSSHRPKIKSKAPPVIGGALLR